MSKVKVIYRVRSIGIRPGDEATVDSEIADALVENGHAVRAKDAPTEVKAEKK